MSRSRKHTPVCSITTARSCREYKRERAGAERAAQRNLLAAVRYGWAGADTDLEVEQVPWDEWSCERDGKQRFDPAKHPEFLRK